jgi:hypothetical protein
MYDDESITSGEQLEDGQQDASWGETYGYQQIDGGDGDYYPEQYDSYPEQCDSGQIFNEAYQEQAGNDHEALSADPEQVAQPSPRPAPKLSVE